MRKKDRPAFKPKTKAILNVMLVLLIITSLWNILHISEEEECYNQCKVDEMNMECSGENSFSTDCVEENLERFEMTCKQQCPDFS